MPATLTTLQELISQYNGGLGPPQGTTAASELDDYIRQLQGFLINFLSVSFNTMDGTLKNTAISAATFSTGVIPGSAIDGDINGNKLLAGTVGYAQLAKYDNGLGQAAVRENTIDDNAVVRRHIKDGEIVAGKLGAGCINGTGLFGTQVVPGAALVNGSVTNTQIGGVDGSKLASNSVQPTAMNVGLLTGTQVGVPVIKAPNSAGSVMAVIGGSVSAVLNTSTTPPTLELSLVAGATEAAGYAFSIPGSFGVGGGTATSGSIQNRTGWSKTDGDDAVVWNGTANRFDVTDAAIFLVFFELSAYSVESFRALLRVNGATSIRASEVFIPIGTGGVSVGFGAFQLTAAGYFTIEYECGRTQASNGLGYSTLSDPVWGRVLLFPVAVNE